MSCFADCFCWQREAQPEPALALLSPAAQPADPPPPRRQRRDTVDFETSKAKLGALAHVLDETPRTRAMATDTIIAINAEENRPSDSSVPVPAKLSIPARSPLASRSPNVDAAPTRRRKTGFGALSALIEQSPRTRVAANPASDDDPSFLNAMDVSGLVALDASGTEEQAADEEQATEAELGALANQLAATLAESEASEEAPAADDHEDVPTPNAHCASLSLSLFLCVCVCARARAYVCYTSIPRRRY